MIWCGKASIRELGPEYLTSQTCLKPFLSDLENNVTKPDLPVVLHPRDFSSNTCVTCGCVFPGLQSQRDHFKSDWHRHNVKRKLRGKEHISEEDFDEISDVSSISASESEAEDEANEVSPNTAGSGPRILPGVPKVEFEDPTGNARYLVVWKAALPDFETLGSLTTLGLWVVILCTGGHFAGVIYDKEGNVLAHRSFHRYTTRKKQGGSQSSADSSKGRTSKAHSAGATLRRYGEESLRREVREILSSWKGWLEEAQAVYVHAPGKGPKNVLYGYAESPLNLLDESVIRTVPFRTRRPTFTEAKRVFTEMSTVIIARESQIPAEPEQTPAAHKSMPLTKTEPMARIAIAPKEKGTAHLKKRVPCEKEKKFRSAKVEAEGVVANLSDYPLNEGIARIVNVCCHGDIASLAEEISEFSRDKVSTDILSYTFHHGYLADFPEIRAVQGEITLVTIAAVLGKTDMLVWLLDQGANPAIGAKPYTVTKNKAIRLALRRYWASHPDRYDYAAAGVPSMLTAEMEAKQCEKEREKRRRDRAKRKQRARKLKEEEEEAKKPLAVREREKRAAAAEARMARSAQDPVCDMCQSSLKYIVPFERLQFKYCSVDCVVSHKKKASY